MLDEFACEAIPQSLAATSNPLGRGENTGVRVLTEFTVRASHAPVPPERIATLRAMTSHELLALVRRSGTALNSHELLVIHDIAAERWGKGDDPFSTAAIDLSREVMIAAVNKSA